MLKAEWRQIVHRVAIFRAMWYTVTNDIKAKERIPMLVKADKKWDYALGMIKVDGLEPTPEMKELIKKEKRGEISMEEVKKALDRKYKMKS